MFVARKRYLKTRARRTPPSRINFGKVKNPRVVNARPRGVTVSALDPESSDRGSNPREASSMQTARAVPEPRERCMDTLGIEPRAFRMQSGCDTTTPCAR